MRMTAQDFAQALESANTALGRWDVVSKHFRETGFDVVNCGMLDCQRQQVVGIYTTMSEDWMNYYVDQGYAKHDVWFERVKTNPSSFVFTPERAEHLFGQIGSQDAKQLADVADVGIRTSMCQVYVSPGSVLSGFNLGTSLTTDKFLKFHDELGDQIALETAIAAAFLSPPTSANSRVAGWHGDLYRSELLSSRECEVLKWLACGLKSEAIGGRIGISTATVHFHTRNACRRLKARSREQAVAVAIRDLHIVI